MSDEPQLIDGGMGGPDVTSTDSTKAGRAARPKGRKGRPKRTGWRRLLPTWRMVLSGFLVIVLLVAGGLVTGYLLVDIPAAKDIAIAQSNVFLYSDGTPLAREGKVNRENVPLSQVPKATQHAVLAAEDRDFYSESAINPEAMIRAAWNTATGKGKQSGSTITQQYVKNYYLDQEQTVSRKVKEFFISIKLDREVSKDDILEGYLNTSYFGRNAYGIQAAAQAYYGKDAKDLELGEGAYLATLLNAPNAYDVVTHPQNRDRALARWNYVLDGMVKKSWLTKTARDKMTFPAPGKVTAQSGMSGQRGYLIEAVEAYLTNKGIIDEQTLARGGYRITTTIDRKKQDAFVAAVRDKLMSKLSDSRKVDKYVRAGGASIDPKTGEVVALYGGIDYTKQFVNNATRTDYQVGSTFKPLVLTSALQNGSTTQGGEQITPDTIYDGTNQREVVGADGPTGYAPANEDDVDYGAIDVTTATDKSVNSVYAQMAQDVGPAKVEQTAIALGVPKDTPDLTASPSIALGPATASVLDMTEAYATLANHGVHTPYALVTKITKDGQKLRVPSPKTDQAVSRAAADTTTSVLQSVVDGGTATAAQAAGHPAAGKTGTAEDDKAAWFAGYTPDLATVVAVMGQDSATGAQKSLYGATGLPRINGGGYPTEIWAAYTAAALQGRTPAQFDLSTGDGTDTPTLPTDPATTDPAITTPPEIPTSPTDTIPTTDPTTDPTLPTLTPPTGPTTQPTYTPPTGIPTADPTTADPGGPGDPQGPGGPEAGG
ncbi:transglycosylase domain-containing protein [Streptomyces sp. ME19-01-6]|uniref:transglycosylase domain-containing protein n=1 Tax=Streptomyces sp. ME19-01-6 TaxID=3028686 RepID=UPI0029A76A57|nr:transglycosylase domain-containing protein [Streptomyces sp. ME19-01-6]MDX3233270.1 transglycosylase domain-containing protein [Streptomyces sp. ME19-01-6]